MTNDDRPSWANTVTEPEPGVLEYWRSLDRVTCSDGGEDVAVSVVKREGEPTRVFMDGRRLSGHEASLVVAALFRAISVIFNGRFEPAPGMPGAEGGRT